MISKKCFCRIIDSCEQFWGKFDKLMDLLDISPETFILNFFDDILDALVDEIEDINEIDRKKIDPIIYTYAFTFNWGKNYNKDYPLAKIDEVEYKPSSSEELYNMIIKFYSSEKSET